MSGDVVAYIRDYPVERRALVANPMLTSGKLAKIQSSFWDGFVIKFKGNPSNRL